MFDKNIKIRGQELPSSKRKQIKKSLLDLHNLEIMAVNVYRFQISCRFPELKVSLIAAMKNEVGHVQDYLVKLYEYEFRPAWYRWAFWLLGAVIGFGSKISGKRTILKAGIWTESKAISHYKELLESASWDEETYQIIDQDCQDEIAHLNLWSGLLKKMA